jgi:hypothetical protein
MQEFVALTAIGSDNYDSLHERKEGFFDFCGLRGISHRVCVGKGGIH